MGAFAYISILLFVGGLFLALILAIVNLFTPKGKSNPNHPGISENGRDIICPKCKSPYCEYYFEKHPTEITTVRYRPLHPLRPFKETTREVPDLFPTKKYRCKNCGWIFK